METTDLSSAKSAQRFTAAALCMQGLLAGNSQLRVPTDEMTYAFARDAVRFADALLHTLEDSQEQPYDEPVKMSETIYPQDAEDMAAVERFEQQELAARGKEMIGTQTPPDPFGNLDALRVDTSGAQAPVPTEDPRS